MLVPFCGSHILVGSERLPEWYAEKLSSDMCWVLLRATMDHDPFLSSCIRNPKGQCKKLWNEDDLSHKKRFDWLFRSTYIPLRAPEFHGHQRNYTEQRHAISKKTSEKYLPYYYVIVHATTSGPFSSKCCPQISSKPLWHRSPGALS